MFLPTTRAELEKLGWPQLDIILVTGDSYIDSPFIGVSVIGKVLLNAGFRVGIIAQPDIHSSLDISRLGEPALFWGVTGGSVDSMVANYTSLMKKRRQDDYTPGGLNRRRPDRAVIVYTNLIKQHFKNTRPVVLGGIEASLRRVPHYDYWTNRVRASILFDAKADYLLYGMAEQSVVGLANALHNNIDPGIVKGLCYISSEKHFSKQGTDFVELPSYEQVATDKNIFTRMFHTFYGNNDALTARGMYQKHGNRYLVHNPPALPLKQTELDAIYALDYERAQHPYYAAMGAVKALETVKFSISTHRGCYGECNFCAIAVHEGRTVQWRSQKSILDEARTLSLLPGFKGYISDVGGPTANMYGFECTKKIKKGACSDKRCVFPVICPSLLPDHSRQTEILKKIQQLKGVKKAFVASGIRYDLCLHDRKNGDEYLNEIVANHVSGQLKIAPEHSVNRILDLMAKPSTGALLQFKEKFERANRKLHKKQFLTYYLIAAYPGCGEKDMLSLATFAHRYLHINPEQVQVFFPAPSTYAALMYYTETDPFTGKTISVEKNLKAKAAQKDILVKNRTRKRYQAIST